MEALKLPKRPALNTDGGERHPVTHLLLGSASTPKYRYRTHGKARLLGKNMVNISRRLPVHAASQA